MSRADIWADAVRGFQRAHERNEPPERSVQYLVYRVRIDKTAYGRSRARRFSCRLMQLPEDNFGKVDNVCGGGKFTRGIG